MLVSRPKTTSRSKTQWPPQVFDYVSQRVTDPDVAELDMAHGWWVRCGKCENSVLKMGSPFSDASWGIHKNTLKHQRALGRTVQRRVTTTKARAHVASPSPPRDDHLFGSAASSAEVDFSAALLHGAQSDQEFLSLCYMGLAKQKRERTKFEAEVHDVVNAMTNLITEQQDEMDAMRRMMEANARTLDSLVVDVRLLQTQPQRSDALQGSQRSPSPLCRKRNDDSAIKRTQRSQSPLFSKSSRVGTIQHQEKNKSPRSSRIHHGTMLQRSIRSPYGHRAAQRSVSPPLFSPTHRAGALKRSHKTHSALRSHEKSERDPFEWTEHDGDDDSTRRMLHMSQYA